jgi:glucan phosphoethanolaminetransferase (alkaline phosphatase superfamily)
MKSSTVIPYDLLSRFFFAGALFCLTAEIIAKSPVALHFMIGTAILGVLTCLAPAAFSRRWYIFSLGLLWLLTPIVLALLAYVYLNEVPPQPITAVAILREADSEEISSAIRMLLAAGSYKWWALTYVSLLMGATAAIAAAIYFDLRNAVLCLSLLLTASIYCMSLGGGAPSWLFGADAQSTVIGELTIIVRASLEDDSIRREMLAGGGHAEAHESVKVTAPALSILVIGESMRADGLSSAKIDRGTWSKDLGARVRSGLAAWLPPACAGHDSTALSVPMLITGTTPDHQPDADKAPTGLSRLQSAGYDVGWLASSVQVGFAGPEVLNNPHGLYFNPMSNYSAFHDEALLPAAKVFASPLMVDGYKRSPRALVFHIMGSHFLYDDRYPPDLFGPEPTSLSKEEIEDLRYERANENTAKFLTEIASLLDQVKVPAFAIYTSDHGENLLRDHNGLWRHVSPRSSLAAYMVPVFVMWNEAEQKSGAPEKVLASVLKANRLAQRDVYNIWMSLSGLNGTSTVKATEDPKVYGARELGDKFSSISCSGLKP